MTVPRATSLTQLLLSLVLVVSAAALLGGCRSYPACKTDQHCIDYAQGTPFCVERVCRTCRDDSQCGFCQQCDNNQCVRTPGCCGDDADCQAPMVCRDNRCGPQCLSDADCGERERCLSGNCVGVECRVDAHCPEGSRCENYTCVRPPDTTPCADRRFRTVYFDFDEYALRADQVPTLEYNMNCFNRYEGAVDVEGHCDERGTVEYNLALGEKRARAVRDWYQRTGVDRTRMNTISYGKSRPAAQGASENAWRQNRRVEVVWR